MRRNLFWLSDEQWKRIERHLPRMSGVSSGWTIAALSAALCTC